MTGRRAETRRRNTRALLVAAGRLFSAHGYQGVGIETIAAEAGLTTGAIYSIFGAKRGLLLAVLDDQIAQVDEALRTAAADPELTAAETLAACAVAYRDLVAVLGGRQALRLEVEALALVMRDDALRAELAERAVLRTDVVTRLLTDRRLSSSETARRLDRQEAERLAAALTGLLRGLATQQVLRPSSIDDALWIDSAVALLALITESVDSTTRA